jgi:UrcA family protein
MKTFILLAAGATALSVAPAAFADDPQAVVTFNNAELASQAGLAAIRTDIRSAAEDLCIAPVRPTLREHRMRQACVADAIEAAEAQLEQKVAALNLRYFAEAQSDQEDQG